MNLGPEDFCEHGGDVDAFCMLCCRAGEGKPHVPDEREPKTFEECMSEDDGPPWGT